MPTVRVPCTRPACPGSFEDTVAWPGTISMRTVPQRVEPTCDRCHADLQEAWSRRLVLVEWGPTP